MDKKRLHNEVVERLSEQLEIARAAAKQAHDTATDEENVAENKYDTLGLEAAYLAEGQSNRVVSLENELNDFKRLSVSNFDENTPIGLGALVTLVNKEGEVSRVFLSPVAGGMDICFEDTKVLLVTTESPVGKSLMGAFEGDEVLYGVEGSRQMYEIQEVR